MLNALGAIIGAGIMIAVIIRDINRRNIIKNKIEVEAKVIRVKKSTGGEGGTKDTPVFQYTVDGIQYERTYPSSSYKHDVVDYVVTVYCHKKNPCKSLLLDQLTKDRVAEIIILLFGVVLICLAIIYR